MTSGQCGGDHCAYYQDLAAEYAVTDIDGRERDQLVSHVERCSVCRRALREYTEIADTLLELVPSVEPPHGFESRALARLERYRLDVDTLPDLTPMVGPSTPLPSYDPPAPTTGSSGIECRSGETAVPPRGPRPRRLPSPPRRLTRIRRGLRTASANRYTRRAVLAASVILLGALGWTAAHIATAEPASAPPPSISEAAAPPSTGSVMYAPLTRDHEPVGEIYARPGQHPGERTWIYLSLDRDPPHALPGPTTLALQLRDHHGTISTVGAFTVTDGYAAWASPIDTSPNDLTHAQLLEPDGTRYATATLADF